MQAYWTLMRRELAGFFCSMTGYVVIAAVTFLVGLIFSASLNQFGSDPFPMPVTVTRESMTVSRQNSAPAVRNCTTSTLP